MRSGKPGESWKEVGQSDGPKRFFSKKDLVKGEKYQFRVRAVNKAGPSDPSEPSQLMVCKARKREELPQCSNRILHRKRYCSVCFSSAVLREQQKEYFKFWCTEMRFILCKSSEAGPRQGHAERLRKSRKKFYPTMYKY